MGAEEEKPSEKGDITANRANPITADQFLSWKRQKDADALEKRAEADRKRAEDIAAGTVQMNGRELFQHQPWVFDNDNY